MGYHMKTAACGHALTVATVKTIRWEVRENTLTPCTTYIQNQYKNSGNYIRTQLYFINRAFLLDRDCPCGHFDLQRTRDDQNSNPQGYPVLRKQEICSAREMGSTERSGNSIFSLLLTSFVALLATYIVGFPEVETAFLRRPGTEASGFFF